MMSYWTLLVSALVLAGCQAGDGRTERSHESGGTMGWMDSAMSMGQMDSGRMGMAGMNMAGMRAHMDSMMAMSPQQMQAMMARHEQMMSQMMDGIGADMRKMNMSGSSEWSALTDSVKQDLAELPGLQGTRLSARMRAHGDRVKRLIAMHDAMMK